jgi:uncharacterized protein (DUF779 family)
MSARVKATPEALALVERLRDAHGPLVFHQSSASFDGSAVLCLRDDDLPPGPDDAHVGDVGGFPFYVDAGAYRRWGRPLITVDVAPGPAESSSLEGLEGVHFVMSSRMAG